MNEQFRIVLNNAKFCYLIVQNNSKKNKQYVRFGFIEFSLV